MAGGEFDSHFTAMGLAAPPNDAAIDATYSPPPTRRSARLTGGGLTLFFAERAAAPLHPVWKKGQ